METRAAESRNQFIKWHDALADRVLAGARAERGDLLRLLAAGDEELPDLLRAAYRIRARYWGKRVKLCMLRNARSGLCPEDCHYCSQSAVSKAPIEKYRLQSTAELLEGARRAVANGARRYCMVTSGRGPSERDISHLSDVTRQIKIEFPELEICVSLGIMSEEQGRDLREAGVGWVNHNLNTSARFHPEICTTHTYADRVSTVRNVARAGLHTCCGLIAGMGETREDLADVALALRDLEVDSLPVNFLHPIDGTPLAGKHELTPAFCLKVLCMVRFANPRAELRVAGGRELNLGWFQALAVYPANSIFVEGYLTTPGQHTSEAQRMVEEMGFEVEPPLYPAA
jgi:biotin synthase